VDERYTSKLAKDAMLQMGMKKKRTGVSKEM
jgi:RNase H-fold protein (predicted Holliday junction resolvase)